jgi:hypothetical protein
MPIPIQLSVVENTTLREQLAFRLYCFSSNAAVSASGNDYLTSQIRDIFH